MGIQQPIRQRLRKIEILRKMHMHTTPIIDFVKIMGIRKYIKWLSLSNGEKYAYFQKEFYDYYASKSKYGEGKKEYIVGNYDLHNTWKDYDRYLMKYAGKSHKNKIALDFGCGPGRNIIKFNHIFKRIDGMDISSVNIKNAEFNLKLHGIKKPQLFVNNGYDLKQIKSSQYDYVFSTISMQHICVYDTRFSLLKEMSRVLKKGGRISIQMGYGNDPGTVGYHSNKFNAISTNSGLDVRVEDPEEIKQDLENIGFSNFQFWIRPTGPGDREHKNWIFFTAIKN